MEIFPFNKVKLVVKFYNLMIIEEIDIKDKKNRKLLKKFNKILYLLLIFQSNNLYKTKFHALNLMIFSSHHLYFILIKLIFLNFYLGSK